MRTWAICMSCFVFLIRKRFGECVRLKCIIFLSTADNCRGRQVSKAVDCQTSSPRFESQGRWKVLYFFFCELINYFTFTTLVLNNKKKKY